MLNLNKERINMYDLLICLTNAGDLISPEVADHHQQVAYLAFKLGEQMELPLHEKKNLMLAGLLHDVGAFSLDERLTLIEEEVPTMHDHAFRGAKLLEGFLPLSEAASIIRYHHLPWDNGAGKFRNGNEVPYLSHVLHLADRIAVSIQRGRNVIDQIEGIREHILKQKGTVFVPEMVDSFLKLSINEYVWLDIVYKPLLYVLPSITVFEDIELDYDDLISLTQIFANITDFRNPFTANHSAGVAKTAEKLAELAGFSENECRMMLVAGYLHDLGKLAVSKTILDKPGKLSVEEHNVIRSHTFYTFRLLQAIKGFETINLWASLHHEKLDGKGYPFHLQGDSIPLGSRIMAVADIFTAITEDRPYRKGMTLKKAMETLYSMVNENAICPYVVSLLVDHMEEVDEIRKTAQEESAIRYNYIMT